MKGFSEEKKKTCGSTALKHCETEILFSNLREIQYYQSIAIRDMQDGYPSASNFGRDWKRAKLLEIFLSMIDLGQP